MTVDQLLSALASAKIVEADAKKARIEIEQQIVALVQDAPEKGSVTMQGDTLRCSIKFGLNYKCDVEAMRHDDNIPAEVMPLKHQAKWVLDTKEYERIREDHPDVFARLAQYVTATAAKPSLTLKV